MCRQTQARPLSQPWRTRDGAPVKPNGVIVDNNQQWVTAAQVSGSIVGALLQRDARWRDLFVQIFVALTFTTFATPVLCDYYQIRDPLRCGLIGYLNGNIGYLVMLSLSVWVGKHDIIGMILGRFQREKE